MIRFLTPLERGGRPVDKRADARKKRAAGHVCSGCFNRIVQTPCQICAARNSDAGSTGGFDDEPSLLLDDEAGARYEQLREHRLNGGTLATLPKEPEEDDVHTQ